MINTDRFNFMSLDGDELIPTSEYVQIKAEAGTVVCILFDSNICLDLISFIENRNNVNNIKRNKIQHLLTVIQEAKCDVLFSYPIFELCMNKADLTIDMLKAKSFADKIWEAIHLNITDIYSSDYSIKNIKYPFNDISGNITFFKPMLNAFYVAFLKIILIAKQGISKKRAYINISTYAKFLNEELDLFSTLLLQPAFAIFGGNSKERKFLGIDKSNVDFTRIAWGAALDAWLYFMGQIGELGKYTSNKQKISFVTDDAALFKIFSKNIPRVAIYSSSKIPLYMNEVDFDYPHFIGIESKIGKLIDKIQDQRKFKQLTRLENTFITEVKQLEKQVRELTRQFN